MRSSSLIGTVLLLLSGCSSTNPRLITRLNQEAAPVGALPLPPLQGKTITTFTDSKDATMSVLFGNALAADYARTHAQRDYPPGAILSLVTWRKQEDERWFGGKIPASPKSVEYLEVRAGDGGRPRYLYAAYEGEPMAKVASQEGQELTGRAAFVLSLRAAVMP